MLLKIIRIPQRIIFDYYITLRLFCYLFFFQEGKYRFHCFFIQESLTEREVTVVIPTGKCYDMDARTG